MQELIQNKKRKLIEFLAERNILIEPEFLEKLSSLTNPEKISELINSKISSTQPIQGKRDGNVKVLESFKSNSKKITPQDFISHFNARYSSLKKILQQRQQLENITSVGKLRNKAEKEQVSVVAMIYSKEETKNGIMLTIEDPTGSIKAFITKNKQDLFLKAKDLVPDEMIGISGSMGKNIIFSNELFFPDIPITKEIKKSPVEEYAVFASDIHVGSKKFLEEEFLRFIYWLRGGIGNEKQKEIASKVKYLFIIGDSIDGISIYPTQKEELMITTFREQYKKLAEYLKLIPDDIKIILSPGQHDIVQLAEPQPPLPKEYCEEIYELPNVILVSNPALVNIGAREGFPGFDILLYHGASYNHYAHDVESIRTQTPNISERSEHVMKLLLQKRHLSPTFDGNPTMPTELDNLIIDKVPDIFASGDVHKSAIFNYKGLITGIVSSCFQSKTSFQEKVGHVPDPGRIPIINLKTREVKIMNFSGVEK